MKIYSPIFKSGIAYLRQRNPLIGNQHLISAEMYAEHERLYEDSALLLIGALDDVTEYKESELDIGWQYTETTGTWIDCAEPAFIDTKPDQYRQVFRIRKQELSFQQDVNNWLVACFGEEIAKNIPERSLRFLEEALELVQALGLTSEQAHRMVAYTFTRAVGEAAQEVGGVMVTLAALCNANNLQLLNCADNELKRVLGRIDETREKHQTKIAQNITAV